MQRGGCRGRCDHSHECTPQWWNDSAHQLTVFQGCFGGLGFSYPSRTGQSLSFVHSLKCPSKQILQTRHWVTLTTNNWGRSNVSPMWDVQEQKSRNVKEILAGYIYIGGRGVRSPHLPTLFCNLQYVRSRDPLEGFASMLATIFLETSDLLHSPLEKLLNPALITKRWREAILFTYDYYYWSLHFSFFLQQVLPDCNKANTKG